MNTGGWFFMLTSLALVWGVTIWAYSKLLGAPREKRPAELPEARVEKK